MKNETNFYWEIISPQTAKLLYKEGQTEIYKLYSDDTEALIENEQDLNDAIDLSIELGLEKPIG